MKKITFPHMGNLWIAARAFFSEMGLEVIVPPKMTRKSLDLGVKYSPEFACLPLKLNLGNFIEAIEEGANTIVMGGGIGPCRFGYYGEVQREILSDLGYDFEMVIIEPDLIYSFKKLNYLFNGFSLSRLRRAGKLAWIKINAFTEIEKLVKKTRAREKTGGQVDKLYQEFLLKLNEKFSVEKIEKLIKEYTEKITAQEGEYKRGIELKVGIVGEIYLVIEPFINLDTEQRLGELGVVTSRRIYIRQWIYDFLHISNEHSLIEEAAKPYLNSMVGGHGLDTVGNTVRYAQDSYDGIVQLAPFTCMPEIVAKSVLPETGRNEEIAVLSLFFDEHTGEAGLQTRLEAFVDMLIRKKERRERLIYG